MEEEAQENSDGWGGRGRGTVKSEPPWLPFEGIAWGVSDDHVEVGAPVPGTVL